MADKEDKWEGWRSKDPDGDAYRKAQEGFLKGQEDNPIINAYRWLIDDEKKKKKD